MEDFEIVYKKYYKYVKQYAVSLCFDELLAEEITQEAFIKAFEESENGSFSLEEMKVTFKDWAADVKRLFFKLSETEPAPAERIKWAEAILDLAGWVTDLTLFIERAERNNGFGEHWMIKHAIIRYYQSLNLLREKCNI